MCIDVISYVTVRVHDTCTTSLRRAKMGKHGGTDVDMDLWAELTEQPAWMEADSRSPSDLWRVDMFAQVLR